MKYVLTFSMGFIILFTLAACENRDTRPSDPAASQSNAGSIFTPAGGDPSTLPEDNSSNADPEQEQSQILVACFSRSGNTEQVAREIEAQTGGTLFEIAPEEPYPDDYDATVERFRQERDADARPLLASSVENMEDYDVVFVGYPIWGGDMPHVVRTFLEEYGLRGKTVIPFCTHGGSGFSASIRTLEALCSDSTILGGYEIYGSDAGDCGDEIAVWLDELGVA